MDTTTSQVLEDVQDVIEIQFNIRTGTSTTRRKGLCVNSGRLQHEKQEKTAADLVLTFPGETDKDLHPSGVKIEHRSGRKVKRTAKRTRTLCEFPLCVSVAQTGRYGRMCKKHSREVAGLSNDNDDRQFPSDQPTPHTTDPEMNEKFAKKRQCGTGINNSIPSNPRLNSSLSPNRNLRDKPASGCFASNNSLPDTSTNLLPLYDTMVVPEGWSKAQRTYGSEIVISFAKERGPTLSPHDIACPRPMELFLFNNSRHVLVVNGKPVIPSRISVTLPNVSRPLKWDNVTEVLSSLHLFYAPCTGNSVTCELIIRKPCTVCPACRKYSLGPKTTGANKGMEYVTQVKRFCRFL